MRSTESAAYLLSGKRRDQLLERAEGLARHLRIALGQVLLDDVAEQALVLAEIHQTLQVIRVVDVGAVGVRADEAIAGGDRRGGLALAIVGVRTLEDGLLRMATIGEAAFERVEQLDRAGIISRYHRAMRLVVQLLGGPARRLILHFREPAATREAQRGPQATARAICTLSTSLPTPLVAANYNPAPGVRSGGRAGGRRHPGRRVAGCDSTRRWRAAAASIRAAGFAPGSTPGRVSLAGATSKRRDAWTAASASSSRRSPIRARPHSCRSRFPLRSCTKTPRSSSSTSPRASWFIPGSGNWDGTLANALLHHAPELAAVPRAGIVHRLDKDTSGLLVVAQDDRSRKPRWCGNCRRAACIANTWHSSRATSRAAASSTRRSADIR